MAPGHGTLIGTELRLGTIADHIHDALAELEYNATILSNVYPLAFQNAKDSLRDTLSSVNAMQELVQAVNEAADVEEYPNGDGQERTPEHLADIQRRLKLREAQRIVATHYR